MFALKSGLCPFYLAAELLARCKTLVSCRRLCRICQSNLLAVGLELFEIDLAFIGNLFLLVLIVEIEVFFLPILYAFVRFYRYNFYHIF